MSFSFFLPSPTPIPTPPPVPRLPPSNKITYTGFLSFKINSFYYYLFNATSSTVEQGSGTAKQLLTGTFSQKIGGCQRPCFPSPNVKDRYPRPVSVCMASFPFENNFSEKGELYPTQHQI